MSNFVLFISLIILISIFANSFFKRFGIPSLLVFMLIGMIFGADGIFKIKFDNFSFASDISSVALIFLIFYGGFLTKLPKSKSVTLDAFLLSSFGTVLTQIFLSLFCYFALKIGFIESFLIGAVLSSTDAASVFAILRSKNLKLKYDTKPLLEIESGSNDPFSYMLTLLGVMLVDKFSISDFCIIFLKQIVFSVVFALIFFGAFSFIVKKTIKYGGTIQSLLFVSGALLAFSVTEFYSGNGYLCVYLFGLFLGNSKLKECLFIECTFESLCSLSQILIFFCLGFLSVPSTIKDVFFLTLPIGLFLIFAARPIAVFLIMPFFKAPLNQMVFVSFVGLRGAASIVFAIFAMTKYPSFNYDIFHIVFFISLLSITVQGAFIPLAAKKLKLVQNYP